MCHWEILERRLGILAPNESIEISVRLGEQYVQYNGIENESKQVAKDNSWFHQQNVIERDVPVEVLAEASKTAYISLRTTLST